MRKTVAFVCPFRVVRCANDEHEIVLRAACYAVGPVSKIQMPSVEGNLGAVLSLKALMASAG